MDNSIDFNTRNILTGVNWLGTGFVVNNQSIIIQPSGSLQCELSELRAYKHLKSCFEYALGGYTSVRYNPVLKLDIVIKYSNNAINNFSTLIGDDITNGIFIGEDVYDLFTGTKTKFTVTISNISNVPITINNYKMFISDEVTKDSILEVIEENTISAEVIHGVLAWVENLQVNNLETNLTSINSLQPYVNRRDYIKIKDRTIDFLEDAISDKDTDVKQLYILANGQELPVFWTAVNSHEQAYKYVTFTDPRDIYDDLSDAEYNNYKYMVRGSTSSTSKMCIEFEDVLDKDGISTGVPKIRFGAGTTLEEGDEVGCAIARKGLDGFELYYTQQNGKRVGLYMGDTGGKLEGFDVGMTLKDIKFYSNGFIAQHGTVVTKYSYKEGSDGKLLGLTTPDGVTINISYNDTAMP